MFGEKSTEFSSKQGKDIPVWQSDKYVEAKNKAVELIKSNKYGLTEGDFWILMNETKSGKMGYSGLIISHNGCLKINDNLDNKVQPDKFHYENNGYNNSLIFTYCDDELFEVGEVSTGNCKNQYPYAMALKRCFDRVVLKKCKLAYAGVYSDSEAEEFQKPDVSAEDDATTVTDKMEKKITKTQAEALKMAIDNNNLQEVFVLDTLTKYHYYNIADIKVKDYKAIVDELKKGAKE